MPDLGVYLHFPWCRNLCSYCDFPVAVVRDGKEPPHDAYRDAILDELAERGGAFAGRALVSIYLGGGTPSLWRPDCVADVIAAIAARWAADPADLEVTIEANPVDCAPDRMAAWRAAGINRVSIGVQSVDAGELVTLGRDHRMGDGPAAVTRALAAGFRSVSADLILGTPGAGAAAASPAGLAALIAAGVPHLSVYELTIEPRTALGRAAARGALTPRDDDELAALYEATHRALEAAGYEHYEVSSYARPGHRAIHNGLYWRGVEFLGLGVGAASFRLEPGGAGVREVADRAPRRWLAARGPARIAETIISPAAELAADRVWLALRTRDGARLADVRALPGGDALADRLVRDGLVEPAGDRLRPTLRGFLYNDRIARLVVTGLGGAPPTGPG